MIRTARSKIASKVAKIDLTDDFHFAKWLRPPRIKNHEVKALYYSEVLDGFEVEQLKLPNSLKLKFKLDILDIPALKQKYLLEHPRAYLIFFGLTKPQLFTLKERLLDEVKIYSLNSQLPQIPKVVDQSSLFIGEQTKVLDQSPLFIVSKSETSDKSDTFILQSVPHSNPDFEIEEKPIKEVPYLISLPEVKDYLADLIPEVFNIDLLSVEQFEESLSISDDLNNSYISLPDVAQIKVPGIDDIINSTAVSHFIPFDYLIPADVQFYSPSFDIPHPVFKVRIDLPRTIVKKVVVKQKNFDPVIIDALNDERITEGTKNIINSLLSSYRELSWTDFSSSLNQLDPYDISQGEFLTSNPFAVLCDELGCEKFNSVAASLSYLFKKGSIKSILLISEKNRFKEFWSYSFKQFTRELKIKKYEPGTTRKVKGASVIWFADIDDLGRSELKDFDKIDLVLFDELINYRYASQQIDQIITHIEPTYIWFLSAINNQKALKKHLEELPFTQKIELAFFGNTIKDLRKGKHTALIKDIWLSPDEMQLFEYNEAITQAKEELNTLFDSPNPIRFQSNIFTIIHKLKQILNFSSFRNISPKANLLTEQLNAVHSNKKKAVVFTQYDENGMKKLEKVFDANNVRFVVGRNGMSAEDLKNSLDNFYDRSDVTVLLTNLKPSRLKLNLSKVSYIFNFDLWWNPVTVWQNDDEIGINDPAASSVVMYNYNIRQTFEEDLLYVLEEKGFSNRYLFDNIKSETLSELITPDDWLTIFGMNDGYKKSLNNDRNKVLNKLQSIDLSGYKAIMKYFFSFLGYRDITIMDIDDEPMFYIIGKARKGSTPVNLHCKCLLTTNVRKEDYEEVVHFKPAANEIKRKFIITNGEFNERITNGTMYIDGRELANLIITLDLKAQLTRKKAG
ncbi:MAG: C-terminal helicase domain-containing protein [Ignavibacterium sp.]|jgi:hypothetical protein|nr:C-terminal helicase domain-containing protein [Ignavibacterium sp.]MEB2297698.1 C-terminal helicase domain-containing protein [Ignavibacteria bacterium]